MAVAAAFFFFCTDVVGEETIQIENRLFLMIMIYFPRATGFCLRSTKYKVNLNGFDIFFKQFRGLQVSNKATFWCPPFSTGLVKSGNKKESLSTKFVGVSHPRSPRSQIRCILGRIKKRFGPVFRCQLSNEGYTDRKSPLSVITVV